MNNKISIIIPVCNVEAYIRKCLDSVINQTYSNLEILLINDGSTDNSGIICDEYAGKDSRIKVFHKKNGGVSSALNVGLSDFTGDYIGFVDPDDWIETDMFEELFAAVADVDIAVCSYFRDDGQDSVVMKNRNQIRNSVIPPDEMLLYPLMRDYYIGFCGYMWNKLFRRKLVANLCFDESINYAQDVLLYSEIVNYNSATGTYINKPLYHYVQRAGAITKSESFDVKTDILEVYKRVEKLLPEKDKYWARGFYCYHASVIYELAVKKMNADMLAKMQDEIKAFIDDYIKTNIDFPEKNERMKRFLT